MAERGGGGAGGGTSVCSGGPGQEKAAGRSLCCKWAGCIYLLAACKQQAKPNQQLLKKRTMNKPLKRVSLIKAANRVAKSIRALLRDHFPGENKLLKGGFVGIVGKQIWLDKSCLPAVRVKWESGGMLNLERGMVIRQQGNTALSTKCTLIFKG